MRANVTILARVVCILFVLAGWDTGYAQAPLLVHYQAFLADSSGQPLPGPTIPQITFSIYDSETSTTPVKNWVETHTSVPIEGGVYSLYLGSVTPLPPQLIADSGRRFLSIRIGGPTDPELLPRQKIASSFFALRTVYADTLGGFGVSRTPTAGSLLPLNENKQFPREVIPPDSILPIIITTTEVKDETLLDEDISPQASISQEKISNSIRAIDAAKVGGIDATRNIDDRQGKLLPLDANGEIPLPTLVKHAATHEVGGRDPINVVSIIPNRSLQGVKLVLGAVTDQELGIDAVIASKIKDKNVTTSKIDTLAVTWGKIRDGAIRTSKLDTLAVTTGKIADSVITTRKIAGLNVTGPKIAEKAITTEKLADSSVTNDKIDGDAVTTDKIRDGTIENRDISDVANIAQSKISNTVRKIDADKVDGKHASDFIQVANPQVFVNSAEFQKDVTFQDNATFEKKVTFEASADLTENLGVNGTITATASGSSQDAITVQPAYNVGLHVLGGNATGILLDNDVTTGIKIVGKPDSSNVAMEARGIVKVSGQLILNGRKVVLPLQGANSTNEFLALSTGYFLPLMSGTGQLVAGSARVDFSRDFTTLVAKAKGYHVSLTPRGMTKGILYVPEKDDTGFAVSVQVIPGLDHLPDDIEFDWLVVADSMQE